MSGQLLVQPPRRPDERHLRVRLALEGADEGRELRFVDQRMFGGLSVSARRRRAARRDRAHRPRPARPAFDDDDVRARVRRRTLGRSSGCCSTRTSSPASATSTPTRRCGAPGCTASGPATGSPPRQVRELLGHAREVMSDALGQGGTSLRRALRQRQRRVRLLRPLAARLRPRGRAVRPLRDAGAPGRVHEPLVVLLPGLPAGPAPAPARGRRRRRAAAADEIDPGGARCHC